MGSITRYRGDTVPDKITVKDADAVVINITAYSFILTVSSIKAPPDTSTQLMQLTGAITSGPLGTVEFSPTAGEANVAPGKYFYDIQMTDGSGKIQTIDTGTYTFKQDITK